MATPSFYYYGIGKSITFNGSTLFTAYGADLSPQHPTYSGTRNGLQATGERSFDCSGFQPGNSVLAYTWTFVSWGKAGSGTIDLYLFSSGGTKYSFERHWNYNLGANQFIRAYSEIAIMDGQIWDYTDNYRLLFHYTHSGGYEDTKDIYFDVNNMYIDTNEYEPGAMTVEGTNLIYTDYGGYKHIIQYDSNYSGSSVGSNKAGNIRVQNGVVRRLYYVDEYGRVRRTYEADNRYGSPRGQGVSVGTQYSGALRTGNSGASGASAGYLCFVNSNGYKMRLMNGDPNNF